MISSKLNPDPTQKLQICSFSFLYVSYEEALNKITDTREMYTLHTEKPTKKKECFNVNNMSISLDVEGTSYNDRNTPDPTN